MAFGNSIFDSSIQIDPHKKQMSQEEFEAIAFEKLQNILTHEFPGNPGKQRIKRMHQRWQFACPFCGDSAVSDFKRRGQFLFKEGPWMNTFKCFNCGKYMSILDFFKKFNSDLSYEATDYLVSQKGSQHEFSVAKTGDEFKNAVFGTTEIDQYGLTIDEMCTKFGLQKISRDAPNRGFYYLCKRSQFSWNNFLYDPGSDSILALNLVNGDRVISFQMRPLEDKNIKNGRKYTTVSLQMIHENLLKDGKSVPQRLVELSMIFNIYNVNTKRPILVTEGPLDSLLLPNCIATMGAAKKVTLGLPLHYVYDSDKTGNADAIEKLKRGNSVFLWQRLKDEYGLPERKKWDINDFVTWCYENHRSVPRTWSQYFSSDPMDILDV